MSKEVHSAIHQFVERRLTIEASILNTGRLNMTSDFDNIIIIVGKWKFSSFYWFRPTPKYFCDYFKNGSAFHKIQIIITKKIVVFVFNFIILYV